MKEFYNKLTQEADEKNFTKLEDFTAWYHSYGNPLFANETYEIYQTDIAHSIPIFRWKNFQVELYVIHSLEEVGMHSHPYVQVIQRMFSPMISSWLPETERFVFPNEHGKFSIEDMKPNTPTRTMLLTYEKWHPDVEMTSLTVMWKGATVGPLQEKEIARFYPNALVEPGYADVMPAIKI